jgi:hypothetical protein
MIMGTDGYKRLTKALERYQRKQNKKAKKKPSIDPRFKSMTYPSTDGSPMTIYYIPMPLLDDTKK